MDEMLVGLTKNRGRGKRHEEGRGGPLVSCMQAEASWRDAGTMSLVAWSEC
jgi:hypothetical protein